WDQLRGRGAISRGESCPLPSQSAHGAAAFRQWHLVRGRGAGWHCRMGSILKVCHWRVASAELRHGTPPAFDSTGDSGKMNEPRSAVATRISGQATKAMAASETLTCQKTRIQAVINGPKSTRKSSTGRMPVAHT